MDVIGQAFEVGQNATGAASLAQWIEGQVSGGAATHLVGTVRFKVSQEEYILALMATSLAKAEANPIGSYVVSGAFDIRRDNGVALLAWLNQAQVGLLTPATPEISTIVAGSLAAQGTVGVKVALVNAAGTSIASSEATITVAEGSELAVESPVDTTGLASGWNVYFGAIGEETLQNTTPLALGTSFTQTALATTTGAAAPTTNTSGAKYLQAIHAFERLEETYVVPVLSN